MIIDNADDLSAFSRSPTNSQAKEVNPGAIVDNSVFNCIPQSSNGSVVITSRNRDVAFRLTGSHSDIVKVDPMDEENALSLLRKKLRVEFCRDEAIELLGAIDFMPLAISQAASYISRRAPRTTIATYMRDLRQGEESRKRLLKLDFGDTRRDGTASNSILLTWQMSFEHIRKNRPTATQLLSLMSLFDRQGIPEFVLIDYYKNHGRPNSEFEEDIETLAAYSLISVDRDGDLFDMHRLVQFSTKTWLGLNDELERWKEEYITILGAHFPDGNYENWKACERLFPHAEAVLSYRPMNKRYLEDWWIILSHASEYAETKGDHFRAEILIRASLEAAETCFGKQHSDTALTLNRFGIILKNQGRYEESEAMYRQALEGYGKMLDMENDLVRSINFNLGNVLCMRQEHAEAETILRQVLEVYIQKYGPEHRKTLDTFTALGIVLYERGNLEEAEAMTIQALEGCRKVLGPDHPSTLLSLGHLSDVLARQKRYEEAEFLSKEAWQTLYRVLGRDHPYTLSRMQNRAQILYCLSRTSEAIASLTLCLELSEKKLGAEHPDTLLSRQWLEYISASLDQN